MNTLANIFFVTRKEAEDRLNVCKTCDIFVQSLKLCGDCKCYMPFKVILSMYSCPKNKWGQSNSAETNNPFTPDEIEKY